MSSSKKRKSPSQQAYKDFVSDYENWKKTGEEGNVQQTARKLAGCIVCLEREQKEFLRKTFEGYSVERPKFWPGAPSLSGFDILMSTFISISEGAMSREGKKHPLCVMKTEE